ncbi:hypothetical protein EDB19DRAFT_1835138 [Suillus lakei]|nr:hypothetical protein EDB19DRAFT_1835138 [Suillus lakei]
MAQSANAQSLFPMSTDSLVSPGGPLYTKVSVGDYPQAMSDSISERCFLWAFLMKSYRAWWLIAPAQLLLVIYRSKPLTMLFSPWTISTHAKYLRLNLTLSLSLSLLDHASLLQEASVQEKEMSVFSNLFLCTLITIRTSFDFKNQKPHYVSTCIALVYSIKVKNPADAVTIPLSLQCDLIPDIALHESDGTAPSPTKKHKRKCKQARDINNKLQVASHAGSAPPDKIPSGRGTPAPHDPTSQGVHLSDASTPKKRKKRKPHAASTPDEIESGPSSSKKHKHKTKKAKQASAQDAHDQSDSGVPSVGAAATMPLHALSQADVSILHQLSIIIDPIHKIAICIDCEITIPANHVCTHAVSHNFRPPPKEVLQPILTSLGCVNKFTAPLEPIPPIIGLKVHHGYSCSIDGCGFLAAATHTMQDQFSSKHPGYSYHPNSAECDLQWIYEFRSNQTLILINLNLIMPPQLQYPFTMLREEMHLLSSIAHSETRLPCLLWNAEHMVLQVDGSPLIISAIRDMVNLLMHHTNALIMLLCEGVDMADFNQCLKTHLDPKEPCKWPKDPLHNNTPSYSFIQDPDDPFKAFQDHLLQSFYDEPQILNKYHVRQPTGTVFKQGGPARGTELETYRLTNTCHISFIMGYNKSRQHTDYPDKYVAHPIYHPLQPIIMDLGPQMIKAIMCQILNLDIDDKGDQQDDAIDESFGHSTNTGRSHYGLTWNDLPSLYQDMISELFQVSQHFWTWLDDSKGAACEPQISYTNIHEMASATLGKLQVAAAEQTVVIQEAASNNKLILDMLQLMHEKIDRTHQAIIQAQAGSGHASQSPVHDIGPMDIAFIRTQGLCTYLANSLANFKTIQQALAVEVISQDSPHILIVMPTGLGRVQSTAHSIRVIINHEISWVVLAMMESPASITSSEAMYLLSTSILQSTIEASRQWWILCPTKSTIAGPFPSFWTLWIRPACPCLQLSSAIQPAHELYEEQATRYRKGTGAIYRPPTRNNNEEPSSSDDSDVPRAPKALRFIPYSTCAKQSVPSKCIYSTTQPPAQGHTPVQRAYVPLQTQSPRHSGPHRIQAPDPPSNSALRNGAQDPFLAGPALGQGYPTTQIGKEEQIGQWCQMNKGKCLVCLFFSVHGRHFPYSCQQGILKTQRYQEYKQAIHFSSNGFCYGCLVPDTIHQNQPRPNPKSRFSCHYDNQLCPLAYLIYEHKPIFKAICQAMGINPKKFLNYNTYTKWLGQQEPHPEALTNIQEFLIVYMNLELWEQLPDVQSSP